MSPEFDRPPLSRTRVLGVEDASAMGDSPASIGRIRDEIDRLDDDIVDLLERRGRLAGAARTCKERLGLPLFDPAREAAIVRRVAERAAAASLDSEIVRDIYWRIVQLARVTQLGQERRP